jgi:choline dehydrogenase-like flavoprotein
VVDSVYCINRMEREFDYLRMQTNKPVMPAVALVDSPLGTAAWIAEKFWAWSDHNGNLDSVISKDTLLTNVMLYLLGPGGIDGSFWFYRAIRDELQWNFHPGYVRVPTASARFPREYPMGRIPETLARRAYNLQRVTDMPRGGHFAALEQPQLLREDPTEAWASGPFPHPTVSHEPRIQQLHEDFARLGCQPFHVPLGIMLKEGDPRSRCIRCNTCDGYPCLVNAKADAHTCAIEPALEYPNVTLLTDALVSRLETSASGREVTAVHVKRNGVEERYSADIVAVSCGAINSAALLLRSANEKHPNGLANSSDVVGRHYMGHVNSVVLAVSKCPNPTIFQKTLGVNDFYFGSKDWDFPMGHISFVGKLDGVALSAGAPAIVPGFTLDLMAKHSLDFWLTSEDLPDPNNRVTLDRNGQIVLSYTPNNLEPYKRLQAKLQELMKQQTKCDVHGHNCHQGLFARNLFLGERIPLAGVAHQNGTIRFGNDPKTSALDVNCKAHDVDNLYIVDGSFFASSAAVNPALTIMANALRVGDHLLERMR